MLNILLYQELGKSKAKANTVIKNNNIWDYRRMVKTQLLFANDNIASFDRNGFLLEKSISQSILVAQIL
jgi:hypothetical protein